MEQLIAIKDKIFELRNIINISQIKSPSVSLITEEYIDEVLEQRKEFGNLSSISIDTKMENNNANNESNNFRLSDYVIFSGLEIIADVKSTNNGKANSTIYNRIPNCKKAFVPSLFNNTQSFITQFNYMKNNNNFKLHKKEEDLNDITFDLSGSSFENDGLDNSLNSIIVRDMRNSSYKYKNIKNDNNRMSVNRKNKNRNSTKSKNIVNIIEKKKK